MNKRIMSGMVIGIAVFVSSAYSAEPNKAGEIARPAVAQRFIGSVKADAYHTVECPLAKNISAADQVVFNAPEEAVKGGYKPCPECKPALKSEKFIGEKGTKRYHVQTCKMMRHILYTDMEIFKNEVDAKNGGYQPCPVCIPQENAAAEKKK